MQEILKLHRAYVIDVLLSEDAGLDDNGNFNFLSKRVKFKEGTAVTRIEKRKERLRKLGIPEHLIEQELEKANAEFDRLMVEAGIRKP